MQATTPACDIIRSHFLHTPHTYFVWFVFQAEDFFTLIEGQEGKPLKFYVYNVETDGCREVCM